MKRYSTMVAVIWLSLCAAPLLADEPRQMLKQLKQIVTQQDFGLFQQFYYMNPRPDLVMSAWQFLSKNKLSENPASDRHLVPFYAQLFCNEATGVGKVDAGLTFLTDSDKSLYYQALRMCGSNVATTILKARLSSTRSKDEKQFIESLLSSRPINLRSAPINSPEILDMLWNSFFATGDIAFVKRIKEAMDTDPSDPQLIAIKYAAQFSLSANAANHPVVRELLGK